MPTRGSLDQHSPSNKKESPPMCIVLQCYNHMQVFTGLYWTLPRDRKDNDSSAGSPDLATVSMVPLMGGGDSSGAAPEEGASPREGGRPNRGIVQLTDGSVAV